MTNSEQELKDAENPAPAEKKQQDQWVELEHLLEGGPSDLEGLVAAVEALSVEDAGRVLSRLSAADREQLLETLPPEDAAHLVAELDETQAADIVGEMPAEAAARLVEELDAGARADLLDELDDDEAEAVLEEMSPGAAALERSRMAYPDGTAGALMSQEFLSYPADISITNLVMDLRSKADDYAELAIQYAYVIDDDGRLLGVLRLRDILLAGASKRAQDVMVPNPVSTPDDTTLDKLIGLFKETSFIGVPVTGSDGSLVGVLARDRVSSAEKKLEKRTFLRISGIVGGEELRSMPLGARSARRLSWLIPNIVLNLIAASVIAAHQATLEAAIALAVFLPIVSDMSGCSGNQAVAVSIRELSLGLARPRDIWRVFLKEGGIGILNGIALGLLVGLVAAYWQGNNYLGLVIGSALALNTLISVILGGLVPLGLRSLKIDPALASGPLLTTVTDMCGFFLVLSLAGQVIDKLA